MYKYTKDHLIEQQHHRNNERFLMDVTNSMGMERSQKESCQKIIAKY